MPTSPLRAALALVALLYAGTAPPANAADLSDAERARLAELREGSLAKLVVHESARAPYDAEFLDAEGEEITLARFRGKVVLVNFWATWCPPCIEEMPSIDALARDMAGADFAVVPVSSDFGGLEKPRRFLDENGLDALGLFLDAERALAQAAEVPGLPVTLLLDREGREVARLTGDAEWDSEAARAIIAHLIESTAPAGG